jgi:hypothetical protein
MLCCRGSCSMIVVKREGVFTYEDGQIYSIIASLRSEKSKY